MLNQRIPQIFTLIRFYYLPNVLSIIKENKKEKAFKTEGLSLVIRLGLEPKTPTLKVLCSTC